MTRPKSYLRLDALRRRRQRRNRQDAPTAARSASATIAASTMAPETTPAARSHACVDLSSRPAAPIPPLPRNRSLVVAGPRRTIRKLPPVAGTISAATALRIAAVQMANLPPAARAAADPTMRMLGAAALMTALAFVLLGGAP